MDRDHMSVQLSENEKSWVSKWKMTGKMQLHLEECICCEAYKACQATNRDAATM